jgi:hypothetical protein
VVRIICSRCDAADHQQCPGVVYSRGVRFICSCACHIREEVFSKD